MASPKGQTSTLPFSPSLFSANSKPVDLATLTTSQLSQVKKQLDDELEHLTNSFTQLRAAQAKFRECLRSIAGGVTPKIEGTSPSNIPGRQKGR
jgi:hypothetical protein